MMMEPYTRYVEHIAMGTEYEQEKEGFLYVILYCVNSISYIPCNMYRCQETPLLIECNLVSLSRSSDIFTTETCQLLLFEGKSDFG